MNPPPTPPEVLRARGFDLLARDYSSEVERAAAAARAMAARQPARLAASVEPAHVYRPATPDGSTP